jgi:hypothetical protein
VSSAEAQNAAIALMIRGAISQQPEDQQARIMKAYDEIKRVVEQYEEHGLLALALLGAEKGSE